MFLPNSPNAGVEREQIIDLGMVNARYLKLFNAHCDEYGAIGDMLHKAQKECFEYKNMGTCVSETSMTILSAKSGAVYPILGPSTTEKDFDEARFITSTATCTTLDLKRYRLYEEGHVSDEYDNDDSNYEDWQLSTVLAEFGFVTIGATRLKNLWKSPQRR